MHEHPDLQYAPLDDDMGSDEDLRRAVDLAVAPGADLAGADFAVAAGADLSVPVDLATPPGDLSGLSSCKSLLAATPGLASGSYTIQTAAGPLNVICDMTTNGGGWTLVFRPLTSNYNTDSVDYQIATSSSLWSDATDTLVAYRDGTNSVVGDWAQFALPADWKVQAPFQYDEKDVTVSVVVTGAAAASHTLHYGREDFDANCGDAWQGAGSTWGRICVENTTAPFYNGFNSSDSDGCDNSSQAYETVLCAVDRQFTIAIR